MENTIKKLKRGQKFRSFEGDLLVRGNYNPSTKRYHCINYLNRSRDRFLLGSHTFQKIEN